MLSMGEPPWFPPGGENTFTTAGRNSAVLRYKEKKKARKFDNKIRYESRKARADARRRVKVRFVKAGEAYDYDPLCHTRSYRENEMLCKEIAFIKETELQLVRIHAEKSSTKQH